MAKDWGTIPEAIQNWKFNPHMDVFRLKSFPATCLVVEDLTRPMKIVQMSCDWVRVYIKDNPQIEIVSPRE